MISHNRGRMEKALWSDLGQGDPVHVRELEDDRAEARYVVAEIERHVEAGGSRDDAAVFYRTNGQSRVLEDELRKRDAAYQVIGGPRFYERAEIKDALAYLTLLVNPHDTVSFGRVVNSPRRGIGDTSQARITAYANTIGEPVFDVAAAPDAVPNLGSAAVKAVGRFMSTMERLRERAEGGAAVGDLLQETLEETGYLEALEAERTIEAQGRLENLEELVGGAREYEASADEPSIEDYLHSLALFSQQDDLSDDEGTVTLMTLHNAKGLEYDIVFMVGCEDGVFPHSRAVEAGDLEEERRLCYVGLTRARRELYVTHAQTRFMYGGRDFNLPSRFIAEIPAELTDAEEQFTGREAATTWASSSPAPRAPAPGRRQLRHRRRRGARPLRRRGDHRVVRRPDHGSLRRRRLRAHPDGRLRAAEEAGLVTARLIDGKAVAAAVRERVAAEVAALSAPPGLATVLVGDDPASAVYVRMKREDSAEVGHPVVPPRARARPGGRSAGRAERRPGGGRHPAPASSARRPGRRRDDRPDRPRQGRGRAHPAQRRAPRPGPARPGAVHAGGVMELLAHAGVELEGAEAVVVGRSQLVGKPLAALLLAANATVTQCHSRTRDLAATCRRADVLIAAAGSPGLITADMVGEGATVIDVGTNRTDSGLTGDVDFEAVSEVAGAITPVPGGVGPMTRAMLLVNTVAAAKARLEVVP